MEPPTVPPADAPPPVESPAGILARIDAREREIERALHEAREAADARLRQAREEAERLIAARRAEAEREAAASAAGVVAEARREAGEIAAAGVREAAAVRETPRGRIEAAADALLALVLPAGPGAGGGR